MLLPPAAVANQSLPFLPDGALHSRFVARVHRRYAHELSLLKPGLPEPSDFALSLQLLQETGLDLGAALRVLRQLVLARLAVLDCEAACPMPAVGLVMTQLAEFCLTQAHAATWQHLSARHGQPQRSDGQTATLWILGMGKLGGRELNVSSDIDLIYVYDEEGETAGVGSAQETLQGLSPGSERAPLKGRISNAEFFTHMVRGIQSLLGEVTEHGFVFRLDLALRPHGNAGPVALSLAALASYLQSHGREWERFAWLKSRVLVPAVDPLARADQPLVALVQPFVFRKYLDYNMLAAMRQLHGQIRQHANQRAAGHPERHGDVKLARGGIREIEFTVQSWQVMRGGQYPELRRRNTLSALPCLVQAGLISAAKGAALSAAYVFLRQVEHRVQYLDDQQTHLLPTNPADQTWLAQSMGCEHWYAFLSTLQMHRDAVAAEFDALLQLQASPETASSPRPIPPTEATRSGLQDQNTANSTSTEPSPSPQTASLNIQQRLEQLQALPRVKALNDSGRERLNLLIWRTLQWSGAAQAETAVLRFIDWIETLLRRESYLALLIERPTVHQRLLRLLGASRWSARYVAQHPSVVDELAQADWLDQRFDAAMLHSRLTLRQQALARSGQDDEETLLNVLRQAQQTEVFRTLARDLEGHLRVPQVADDLSALADTVLQTAVRWCWQHFKAAHRAEPQLAVLAYGKLGGRELGYGSDLDLVFVFEDDATTAGEIYASFVRKLLHWLNVKTAAGDLYEIDTALRPNGHAGLLVTSMQAFSDYQLQRSANAAWVWEHQAMTRARAVLGPLILQAKLESLREAVLCAQREPQALRHEIAAMRQRLLQAHPSKAGVFDIKQSPGGMIDVEFAVQHLVLQHAHTYPALRGNVGNQALLLAAEHLSLLPSGVGSAAAQAYATLRSAQHMARLDERPATLPDGQLMAEREAVIKLCNFVGR
jgi:[glutamine synthetase] adenylyltransferase / [glutamine synthetase]-adenylyl-L-tyrosine phosphorylase